MDRVADRKLPRIDEAENVAGDATSMVSRSRPKTVRARCAHRLSDTAVPQHHVLLESAGADTHERMRSRDADPCSPELENEPGEALVGWDHHAGVALRDDGGGASSTSACRNGSSPKLVRALPKNTGVCRPARYIVHIELRARRPNDVERFAEMSVNILADHLAGAASSSAETSTGARY